MAQKIPDPPVVPQVLSPEIDTAESQDWVKVTHSSMKDAEPGVVTREWLDGWGKDQGWTVVK